MRSPAPAPHVLQLWVYTLTHDQDVRNVYVWSFLIGATCSCGLKILHWGLEDEWISLSFKNGFWVPAEDTKITSPLVSHLN